MNPVALSLAFSAAVLASLIVKFWLATRQMRHVAAHRSAVPAAFAATVPLEAHQKAADYTLAKLRLGNVTEIFGSAVLIAWTLLGGLGWLNDAVRDLVAPRWGVMAYQLALVGAFSLVGSMIDLPFELYRHLPPRTALRLQQDDAGALRGRRDQVARAGRRHRRPAAGARAVDHAGHRRVVVAVGVGRADGVPAARDGDLPDADRPALQQVRAARRRGVDQARADADAALRLPRARLLRDGRQPPLGARQRVLHRLRRGQARGVLRHAAVAPERRRGRGRPRARAGHFAHKHIVKRIVVMFAFSLAGFALLGWLATQAGFYIGLGVAPNAFVSNHALALLLFMMGVPPFMFFVSPAFASMSRRAEFEADAYARSNASATDLVRALLKLYEDNAATLTPDPLFVRFYYSHPPASARFAALGVNAAELTGAAA